MPTVFLSYSREDLPLIEQLAARLKNHTEISIWRDQDKIYGGQKWPKILGEAIADQDVCLLAWSKNSAVSHFVEFEWCTAIALKKTIVPCLLDDTPLAPSLKAFHGYRLDDATGLIQSLRGAPLADLQRREPVIRKLNDITATEERAVLAHAKAVFAQQQWTVQGNVYQAGGDIHIHREPATPSAPAKTKPLIEKWQTWVTIVGGILAALLSAAQIKDLLLQSGKNVLGGQVVDELTQQPLGGVLVSIPEFEKMDYTKPDGHFRLQVEGPQEKIVTFTAQKEGYRIYTEQATLGNTNLRFALSGSSEISPTHDRLPCLLQLEP